MGPHECELLYTANVGDVEDKHLELQQNSTNAKANLQQ